MKNLKDIIIEKLIINKDLKKSKPDYNNDPMTWEEGDILCGTAGYSMVLPRFYKIIKKRSKTFEVRRIPGKIISGHKNGQWEEVADEKAELNGEIFKGRINKWGKLKIDGIIVRLWDGEPLYGDDMD